MELAFFGGNFLGLRPETYIRLLETVQPYIDGGQIDGIRFSTRPDTITHESLDCIRPYPVSVVELGVQSMNRQVLLKSRRGHTPEDTVRAMEFLKKEKCRTGVQVMVGLPDDNEQSLMESTEKVAELSPDDARIYPLLVLKGSRVETWYRNGEYVPLDLDDAVSLTKKMYAVFKQQGVNVIRMGLQASDFMEDTSKVIAGPWHPAFGHLVFSEMMYDSACRQIDQHMRSGSAGAIVLKVHPKAESRLRGDKNTNLKKLRGRYPGIDFSILPDDTLPPGQVSI